MKLRITIISSILLAIMLFLPAMSPPRLPDNKMFYGKWNIWRDGWKHSFIVYGRLLDPDREGNLVLPGKYYTRQYCRGAGVTMTITIKAFKNDPRAHMIQFKTHQRGKDKGTFKGFMFRKGQFKHDYMAGTLNDGWGSWSWYAMKIH